jgi:hypothetical protein
MSSSMPSAALAKNPEVIRAKRFELVNTAGRLLGWWRAQESGESSLCVVDDNGHCRVEILSHVKGSALIVIRGSDNEPNFSVGTTSSGRTTLNLRDQVTRSRIVLGYRPSDVPSGDEYSWGLYFPKGAFDSWASIGVTQRPNTKILRGSISILQENGTRWPDE